VLLRRAIGFMESNVIEDIGLANIAEAVHVTPRSVQCWGSFSGRL
jgi:transcriptional regulator GlxA family with amidase domain